MIETLVARPAFARALLDQMATGSIPRADLSAFQARQIRSMGDPALAKKLSQTWGELRDSSLEKQASIARLKAKLTPETIAASNRANGRVLYTSSAPRATPYNGHGGAIGS